MTARKLRGRTSIDRRGALRQKANDGAANANGVESQRLHAARCIGSCDPAPASSSSSSADLAVSAPRASSILAPAPAAARRSCDHRAIVRVVCNGAAPECESVLVTVISSSELLPFDDECCTAIRDGCDTRTVRGYSMTQSQPNHAISLSLRSRPTSSRISYARNGLASTAVPGCNSSITRTRGSLFQRVDAKCEMRTIVVNARRELKGCGGLRLLQRATTNDSWNRPAHRGTRLVLARVSTGHRSSRQRLDDGRCPGFWESAKKWLTNGAGDLRIRRSDCTRAGPNGDDERRRWRSAQLALRLPGYILEPGNT
jgi:hypothetical protein